MIEHPGTIGANRGRRGRPHVDGPQYGSTLTVFVVTATGACVCIALLALIDNWGPDRTAGALFSVVGGMGLVTITLFRRCWVYMWEGGVDVDMVVGGAHVDWDEITGVRMGRMSCFLETSSTKRMRIQGLDPHWSERAVGEALVALATELNRAGRDGGP